MKYVIIIGTMFFSGCALQQATPSSDYTEPLLDPNILVCPHGTFTYCEGRNARFRTCECVKTMNFTMDGFDVPLGTPF
tara:strand:+ start:1249 stop:1482 length:234 start_codon:yes stop_codon:yes gene_type:complete